MKLRIQITDKNIEGLFRLPCVKEIKKIGYGEMIIYLYHYLIRGGAVFSDVAYLGDWLVEEDNGIWHVEKGGEQ